MRYTLRNESAAEKIHEALDEIDLPDDDQRTYYRQIMVTAGKLAKDGANELDLKILTNSLKEIRHGLRIFKKYRDESKIAVFGSARTEPEHENYQAAQSFSSMAAEDDYYLISGGGPGIMEAVNRGAGRENSFGLHIVLPYEEEPNEYIQGDEKCMYFRYFFARKLIFARETDAAVCFPGGFGTHDELFELLCLIQTGRQHLIPLIFCDRDGFWEDMQDYMKKMLADKGKINESDLHLFDTASSPQEALDLVEKFYSNYHSSRFLGNKFLIRFKTLPDKDPIPDIKDKYGSISPKNDFQIHDGVLENEEPSAPENHYRLTFTFDKKQFGMLRDLVRTINSWV